MIGKEFMDYHSFRSLSTSVLSSDCDSIRCPTSIQTLDESAETSISHHPRVARPLPQSSVWMITASTWAAVSANGRREWYPTDLDYQARQSFRLQTGNYSQKRPFSHQESRNSKCPSRPEFTSHKQDDADLSESVASPTLEIDKFSQIFNSRLPSVVLQ